MAYSSYRRSKPLAAAVFTAALASSETNTFEMVGPFESRGERTHTPTRNGWGLIGGKRRRVRLRMNWRSTLDEDV